MPHIKLERLLKIDSLLRSRIRQTQPSLAQATGVSDRIIRSDLTFLRDRLLAPLKYQTDKGWHYTDPNWRLPSIPLSQGEIFALTLGARMLSAYAGSSYIHELETAIKRLGERLPDVTLVDLQRLTEERIMFGAGAEIININPQIWQQLQEATSKSRQVWISYYAATTNSKSERTIDPYLLNIYRGTNPYVVAYCHLRKALRDFRIDRIQQLKVLKTTFTRDPDFDPQKYLENRFQYESGDRSYEIEIWFDAVTAPFIRERRWHKTQELIEGDDGSLILKLKVSGLNDIKRWALGYGKGAVVKNPPKLVEMVQKEIEAMNCNYFCEG
ncbi:MAG: WYL domain-containing protein [Cyanobacteria bacterium J06621_8]